MKHHLNLLATPPERLNQKKTGGFWKSPSCQFNWGASNKCASTGETNSAPKCFNGKPRNGRPIPTNQPEGVWLERVWQKQWGKTKENTEDERKDTISGMKWRHETGAQRISKFRSGAQSVFLFEKRPLLIHGAKTYLNSSIWLSDSLFEAFPTKPPLTLGPDVWSLYFNNFEVRKMASISLGFNPNRPRKIKKPILNIWLRLNFWDPKKNFPATVMETFNKKDRYLAKFPTNPLKKSESQDGRSGGNWSEKISSLKLT